MNKLPQFLYRYRSIASKNLDRTFTHNELYFSRPDQFNDPFDCKTHFTFKGCDEKDIRKYFEVASSIHPPNLSDSEIERFVNDYKSGNATFPQKMINMLRKDLPKYQLTLRMLCLSEVYDNILMWSHYSDGHRGIVLQFDTAYIAKQFVSRCEKVDYYSDFPTLRDYNERFREQMFLLAKSDHWSYEKEWRIINSVENDEEDKIDKVYKIEKEMLAGIILGCEISNEDKDRIRMWRDYGQSQVKIYKANDILPDAEHRGI